MKVDGRFIINGDIPEGQASVNELLAECFDIAYELRIAAESEESAWDVTLWEQNVFGLKAVQVRRDCIKGRWTFGSKPIYMYCQEFSIVATL